MGKKELIDHIVEDVGISRGKASTAVDVILKSLADELRTRSTVKVGAFGTFTAPSTSKRRSTNSIAITGDDSIDFRPGASILVKSGKAPAAKRAAKSRAHR
jgi:nucleoid DNA-binding protein